MKHTPRPILIFLALLVLCGIFTGLALSLTEDRIQKNQAAAEKAVLAQLYPEGKTWEVLEPDSGASALFVCREEGNTPVYAVFFPLSLPREEGSLAVAVKADGVVLNVKALSEARGVGLGESALEETALAPYRNRSALTEDPEATPAQREVFRTVQNALLLVQNREGGAA